MTRMFFHLCLALVFISATSCSIFDSEDESVTASEIEGEAENIEVESADNSDQDESFEDLDIENANATAKTEGDGAAAATDDSFGDIENFNEEQIGSELSNENIANANTLENEPNPVEPTTDTEDLDLEVANLEPQPETTAPVAAATSGSSGNKITNLEYKSQDSGGSVVISATAPFEYQVRDEPEFNQTIIEIANVELPDRFKLPYIAKDFEQAVATVNAYQESGSSTARFVIQYKDKLKPGVSLEGNKLLVTNSGISSTTEVVAASKPNTASGKKLFLEMQDINIKDLIYYIADEVGVNIIVDDNVTGTANVKLKDVQWEEALSIILKTNGLAYERRGEILRVAKIESITNEFTAETRRLEAQEAALRSAQSRAVKVIPINYANLEDLAGQIKPFLTATGNVIVDKRSSSIILNDFDGPLKRAEKLIKSLDIEPVQVQIEGKIIEASEEFAREFGFRWGQSGGLLDVGSQTARFSNNISADRGVGSAGGYLGDLRFGVIESIGNITAAMSIYEREQKIKVLSSPKIVTLNKVKATIESTQPVPIFTTVLVAGAGSQNQVTFTDAKLSLDVTPQVSFNSDMILDIAVSRDIPGPAVGTPPSRGLSKRNAKTQVIVKDGHSLVLGGIFSQDETFTEGGVPLLKDIPVLGYLFKTKTKEVSKTELVIFLTPKILNTESMLKTTEISSTGEVVQSPNETSKSSSSEATEKSSEEIESEVESL
jgi:type IV pilus assembly protein PilQ